jgi:hypothetical protein|nr:MAG TPA: hypothetical protein [Caudoviricetes sp.]
MSLAKENVFGGKELKKAERPLAVVFRKPEK